MEDILFLAVFFGTPVLMVLALLWVGVRALRARMAYGSALSAGWTSLTEDELRHRLHDFPPLLRDKARADRIASRTVRGTEILVARYAWSSSGPAGQRFGRRQAWLVVPMRGQVPHAIVAKRAGGLLEAAAESLAGGARTDLGQDWEWARVSGPADAGWFTGQRAAGLEAVMDAADEVWLHGRFAVFAKPEEAHPTLLDDAEVLSDALAEALD
ncbi:MAG: hypothetical protein KC912_03100 [Proteobacteria bacterium]|nr:hypothetical protein [Pseudomonadota bacterium]